MSRLRYRGAAGRALLAFALLLLVILLLPACDLSSPAPASTTVTGAGPTPVAYTPTSEPPTPALSPSVAIQPSGDGNINTDKLYHDTRDPNFRSPGGPVKGGTDVVLRLRTAPGDLTAASIRIWNSTTATETITPMSPVATDTWQAVVHTPPDGAALWYRFIAKDGSAIAYYNDDRQQDGGVGEGKSYASDTDFLLISYNPAFTTPDWLKNGIVYQIFPDRFYNGDPSNDKPAGSFIYGGKTQARAWGDKPTGPTDFFGGDLKGITDKLDYIKSLGVTAIYLNPIFQSPSNHRYDTTDYTKIDPALGTLDDFNALVAGAKARGIRLILDGVFNHASSDSLYFDEYSRYSTTGAYESKQSPFYNWFSFTNWPSKYKSWSGVSSLPVYSETQAVEDFFFTGSDSIVKRWTDLGIGGWRLDAADQKSYRYWATMRQATKALNPDAAIIGEFWHNSAPWLAGDQWDGTMDYRFRDAVQGWLTNPARNVETMVNQLASIREDYPPQALATSMNVIDSHDTERALYTASGNKNVLKQMALMQFTWPGLPTIYYGDEAGLSGARDPDDRRTYPWGSEDQSLLDYYRTLSKTRESTSALQGGDYADLFFDNRIDVYAYGRKDSSGSAVVALNRSDTSRQFDIPVKGFASDGASFSEQTGVGGQYAVQNGMLKVTVAPNGGILLTGK